MGAAEGIGVGVDTAEVVIVVQECHDELDPQLLRSGNDIIEMRETITWIIVDESASGVERLVVDVGLGSRIIGVAESPNADNFVAGLEYGE